MTHHPVLGTQTKENKQVSPNLLFSFQRLALSMIRGVCGGKARGAAQRRRWGRLLQREDAGAGGEVGGGGGNGGEYVYTYFSITTESA